MTFKQFKAAVKKLAKGEYHHVQYSITEYAHGEIKEEYACYIIHLEWTNHHPTPEEALEEMEIAVKKKEAKK